MKASGFGKWILISAVAALPLALSGRAAAQVPVDDGKAHDANTRIGSGGYNDRRDYYESTRVTGNQIVTGNVTLGRDFHGSVPYTSPLEFRGNLGSSSFDSFVKNSNGAARQSVVVPGQAQAFYGSSLVGPPPAGFVPRGFTGTYTPAPQIQAGTGRENSINAQVMSPTASLMPPAGDYLISGPAEGQPNFVVGSPLTGLRGFSTTGLSEWSPAQSGNTSFSPMQWDTGLQRMKTNPQSILQLREQLLQSISGMRSPFQSDEESALKPGSANPNPNLAKPMAAPFEAPDNPSLRTKPLDTSLNSQPLENLVRPEAGIANRLTGALPSAVQQSSQYAEMQKRLDRYYVDRLKTDEDRNRDFLKQLRAKDAAEKAAAEKLAGNKAPEVGVESASPLDMGPDYARVSRDLLNERNSQGGTPGAAVRPQPLQVHSLATGAKGPLSGILLKAEELMKSGKYLTAVDQYELAARVVPNNPLVMLGRANAELAAGYYRKAETDLKNAMGGDPTLMMGQYDLKAMIGQQRLEELVRDLKEVALKQPNDPGPVLLLAYLAYNTGNANSAGMYLDQADKRAGQQDVFYRLLKMHWGVGQESSAAPSRATTMVLSEVLKQFELGNVSAATLTDDQLSGALKTPIQVPGEKEPVKSFRAKLPAGHSTGPLAKWLTENRKGADLKIQTSARVIEPAK